MWSAPAARAIGQRHSKMQHQPCSRSHTPVTASDASSTLGLSSAACQHRPALTSVHSSYGRPQPQQWQSTHHHPNRLVVMLAAHSMSDLAEVAVLVVDATNIVAEVRALPKCIASWTQGTPWASSADFPSRAFADTRGIAPHVPPIVGRHAAPDRTHRQRCAGACTRWLPAHRRLPQG